MAEQPCFQLRDPRGECLFARQWEPECNPIGGVVIVHGLGDHSGRFANIAEQFSKAGYWVFAHDQVGHGQSRGPRGHVGSYEWLLDDIGAILGELRQRVGTLPMFLYGQSLGGNLVLNYVLCRQPQVSGVIASSPLLLPASEPPFWKRAAARLLNLGWPSFTFGTGINALNLSHDSAVVSAYKSDPLVHDRVSARLAVEMLDAGRWALEHASDLALPALILHGSCDAITRCDASSRFAEAAGDRCALKIWPGLFHELHWEFKRQDVIGFMIHWMNDRRCSVS